VLDRGPQFAAKLTKNLNRMLEIVNIVPSLNRQLDRENEPGTKAIFKVLC